MVTTRHIDEGTGMAFIFATHDPCMLSLAHRVVEPRYGKIVYETLNLAKVVNLRKVIRIIEKKMHQPACYYHAYNRGCNRERLFVNDENYLFLLKRAKSYLLDYRLSVIAYCLMPNHYHFLCRPEEDDSLSRYIQRLFNSYTQAFNEQQGRSGTLFEGRYKSILVDTDESVIHLCRYIHLNPVRAGLVNDPSQWPYSNYLDWVGKRDGILVDREFVGQYFTTPADYEDFVISDVDQSTEMKLQAYCLD